MSEVVMFSRAKNVDPYAKAINQACSYFDETFQRGIEGDRIILRYFPEREDYGRIIERIKESIVEKYSTRESELLDEIRHLKLEVEKLKEEFQPSKGIKVLQTMTKEDARRAILGIFESTDGTIYYSDLVEKLKIDLEQIVEIVAELEKEGVIHEADESDRM